jgi:hypothetical protein
MIVKSWHGYQRAGRYQDLLEARAKEVVISYSSYVLDSTSGYG